MFDPEVRISADLATPGGRPLMSVGWMLFAVSFFLPALSYSCEVSPPPPPPSPDSIGVEPCYRPWETRIWTSDSATICG